MILTSVVLPEPERPKSAVSRPSETKRASSRNDPNRCVMSTTRLIRPSLHSPMSVNQLPRVWPTRRANSSETTSAPIAMTIDTTVSRRAPASPPGICVKV